MAEPFAATLPAVPDDELIDILGRPNFMCIGIANVLREGGQSIARKAEAEQAATILFLLRHWAFDPAEWRRTANEELRAMHAAHQPKKD